MHVPPGGMPPPQGAMFTRQPTFEQQHVQQQLMGSLLPPLGRLCSPTLQRSSSGAAPPAAAWPQQQAMPTSNDMLHLPGGGDGGLVSVPIAPAVPVTVHNPFATAARRGPGAAAWGAYMGGGGGGGATGQDQLSELPGVRLWSASARSQTTGSVGLRYIP